MNHAPLLNVGVVGLGKIAQTHHLPNLASLPGFRVSRVCDLSEHVARSVARSHGLEDRAATTDYRTLLDAGLDAVVVSNRDHLPIVRDSCAAGIPVFVEKPLCWTLTDAHALREVQERTGTPVVVGYMKRYDAAVERLLAESADMTTPLWVRAHNFAGGRHRHERLFPVTKARPDENPGTGEDDSIAEQIASAAGTNEDSAAVYRLIAELAIHHINLVGAFYGPLTATTATAHRTAVGWCVNIGFKAGPVNGTFEVLPDFGSAREWDETLTVFHPGQSTELVFGSPFLWHEPTLIRRRGATDSDHVSSETQVARESAFRRELAHFRQVVRKERAPRTPLGEAVADLEFLADVMTKLTFL
ncbi:Gfo/Idh/MocA family oxidoreductase [Streptomyces sp. NPDC007084]|uniref:Gfo/Idh/MocA family protein n=1 Tax=Streptomyces sp. NPDC007084 TaxID=3154313 RepID=UPI0034557CA8